MCYKLKKEEVVKHFQLEPLKVLHKFLCKMLPLAHSLLYFFNVSMCMHVFVCVCVCMRVVCKEYNVYVLFEVLTVMYTLLLIL